MKFNWGGSAAGGLGGAASGALAGSIIPGLGTALGAGVGGLAGLLTGGFSGNDSGYEESPNKFSPEQQKTLQLLLQQGTAGVMGQQTPGFKPIEDYARSKFQRESIPGLAERFTSLGGSDTRNSSDFAGMLSGAQSEFDQGIAALRSQTALQQLQLGLNPQTEQIYFGRGPSAGHQLLETAGSLAGKYLENGGFSSADSSSGSSGAKGSRQRQLLNLLREWKANKGGI